MKLTVAAVVEDVNELRWCVIPLLASPQGGVAASSRNAAKPPKLTRPGWFSFGFSIGKPPRPREQRRLRNLLDRSATPPCTDARRGIRSILIRSYLDGAPLQGRVSNEA